MDGRWFQRHRSGLQKWRVIVSVRTTHVAHLSKIFFLSSQQKLTVARYSFHMHSGTRVIKITRSALPIGTYTDRSQLWYHITVRNRTEAFELLCALCTLYVGAIITATNKTVFMLHVHWGRIRTACRPTPTRAFAVSVVPLTLGRAQRNYCKFLLLFVSLSARTAQIPPELFRCLTFSLHPLFFPELWGY